MPTNKPKLRWSQYKFSDDEWELIEIAWDDLLSLDQVKIGFDAKVGRNVQLLCNRLKTLDDKWMKWLEQDLPSTSKKYKQLNYFVARMTNPKRSPPKISSQETHLLLNSEEDEKSLFGDAP